MIRSQTNLFLLFGLEANVSKHCAFQIGSVNFYIYIIKHLSCFRSSEPSRATRRPTVATTLGNGATLAVPARGGSGGGGGHLPDIVCRSHSPREQQQAAARTSADIQLLLQNSSNNSNGVTATAQEIE